jgi:hypothetical protein
MYATIRFDREIDKEKHYIVPGGYEMTFDNGVTTAFDFMDYCGCIDANDRTVLYCEMRNLDIQSVEESEFLKHYVGSIIAINDFYIYTGESYEEEINPVELLELVLYNNDDKIISIDKKLLGKIWNCK